MAAGLLIFSCGALFGNMYVAGALCSANSGAVWPTSGAAMHLRCMGLDGCSNNSKVKHGSHGRPEVEVMAEAKATMHNEVASLYRKDVAIEDGTGGVEKLDVPSPSIVEDSFNTCMGNQKELVVCDRGISNDSITVYQRNIIERGSEEEGLVTAGYLRSLSGNGHERPSIKIQIVLNEAIRAKDIAKTNEVNTSVGLCSKGKNVIQAHARESSSLPSSQPISILGRAARGSGVSHKQIGKLIGKKKDLAFRNVLSWGKRVPKWGNGAVRCCSSSSIGSWHKGPIFQVVVLVLSRSSSGGQSNQGRARCLDVVTDVYCCWCCCLMGNLFAAAAACWANWLLTASVRSGFAWFYC
ncbi:hypothetical protein LOK49_LG07G00865 [Camellia lanceoleosa]|uniref:Uncharacterized protein n=1 Tax=Camellia lanceoleosa TaxID=1840588 RepID=A0ACC0GYV1_9ERIC|nr:hypothetical protein LOK49_LG07G00865 [Camellia lanceoleosa]